ncbi:MAG: MBL fold metallo-hydrolase [Planctomycetota bacterium]
MKISFHGANRQVTGSCYLLEHGCRRVLIDCGMFQERKFIARNWESFGFDPAEVDVMLLTHGHLDHCGLIPKLVRDGFAGRILTTQPSVALAEIVMRDSARIQEEDARYKKKRHRREKRRSKHGYDPLYTEDDARRAANRLKPVAFNACHQLGGGISACFHDAGHVLGSASLTVDVETGEGRKTVLFSGDVGQHDKPLIPDPTFVERADYVVLESTYGDRNHRDEGDIPGQLAKHINAAVERGGNVIIPTFAIERAQELLFYLASLIYEKQIPRVPVFLDSPMAINVIELFERYPDFLDEHTRMLLRSGEHPLDFPGLFLSRSHDQSKAINAVGGTAVILAGSGMCTGGRIKHHLVRNISRERSTILFVGYQSPDTLGGLIVRGKNPVRIHGKEREVKAEITQLYGLSAHADHDGLLEYLDAVEPKPRRVFLTHGEASVADKFAEEIRRTRDIDVSVPEFGESVTLD